MLYTFMLCFVVLNVACTPKDQPNQYYALAIGFVIVAGASGAGAISGGCFNPAVALGCAISGDIFKSLVAFLIYTAFELLGAVLAAVVYQICRPETGSDGLVPKLLSEFLGTFMLVLTVVLNCAAPKPVGVFSIAASLMCMIYALGSVSGAHFNPAVTVAIVLAGRNKISAQDAGAYVGVQLVAGCAAAFVGSAVAGVAVGGLKEEKYLNVIMAEIVFTFLLAFVVLSVATTKTPATTAFGLAIGSCVTVGGYAVGAISGGCFNPAVSLGLMVQSKSPCLLALALYFAAQFVGSLKAAVIFKLTRPEEYTDFAMAREVTESGFLKLDA